jgi:hypothetical protein
VEQCLNDAARRARAATKDYLRVVSELLTSFSGRDASGEREAVDAVERYIKTHLSMCP